MVTNNLLIKLKERSKDEIEKVKNLLLSMDGKISALVNIKVETDIRGPEKSGYDIMLITQFNEFGDLDKYLNHPVHLEVSEYIKNVIDTGASLCYES
jgi:ABC-type polysaccharide/polyol phosphate transport system ATPase subunit